ncbi:MAG: AGE family epimerase/isomerase [Chloroflexota bacterium]|nr:AGE family epimerase/isomerase [Chloroflexota bacterium]
MKPERIAELREIYRSELFDSVVPFWLQHSLDHQRGGQFNSLDRDGSVFDTDKSMWLQGRALWMFAKLYNEVERRPEWLEAARHIYDFITRFGFDADGRMFFSVTADGAPLRKRRYLFTETFAIIGLAEYARATGDSSALNRAIDTYRLVIDHLRNPGALEPKIYPETRRAKAHNVSMIMLATTQELRLAAPPAPLYEQVVDDALDQILNHFLDERAEAVYEVLGAEGERLDTDDGRRITPGHAMESAAFVMHEALARGDDALVPPALKMIDYSMKRGWDDTYGGLLYFVDSQGKPPTRLEWDMKLWWPHAEALYALLLAYRLSRDDKYARWFERMHDYTFARFPDPEYGGWYGYLHRDGSLSTPLKGGMWKGFFHTPRALWLCWKLLGELLD